MACDEHEAEEIVPDRVVEGGIDLRSGLGAALLQVSRDLFVLRGEALVATEDVDAAALRRRHEPRARLLRDARFGPALERCDERLLREVLRQSDVPNQARESRDERGRFDPPDRLDGAMDVGSPQGGEDDTLAAEAPKPDV